MQLEELGSSKDVPPLSCRGDFELSTIVENRVIKLTENGLSTLQFKGRVLSRRKLAKDFQEVPG